MTTPNREWFCVGFDGNIHSLGEHDDFENASEVADTLGGSAWIFDKETAYEWRDQLNTLLELT